VTSQQLIGGVSGLSPDQMQTLFKGPYTEALKNLSRVGAKHPRTLMNSGGLWYWGVAPCGDFTGTAMGGSGGPAALPWGPTGQYTIVGAGRVVETGPDTAHFKTSFPLSDLNPSDPLEADNNNHFRYKVALARAARRSFAFTNASWTAATRKIELQGGQTFGAGGTAYSPKGPTGDDWMWITDAGTGGVPGWYRVNALATRDDTILYDLQTVSILTDDASILNAADVVGDGATVGIDGVLIKSNQAGWVAHGAWDADTKQLKSFASFSSSAAGAFHEVYTPGADDCVEIIAGNGVKNTYTLVVSKQDDNTITVADDIGALDFTFSGGTFTPGPNTLVVAGTPFAGYTWKAGDTLLVYSSSDPVWVDTAVRINSKTNDFTLVLGGAGLPAGIATLTTGNIGHIAFVVWRRPVFEKVALDPTNPWVNTAPVGELAYSTVAVDPVLHPAGLSWTPQHGDFYYVYIDGDDAAGALWPNGTKPAMVENDPQNCPTPSAATTLVSLWPYHSFVRSSIFYMKTNGGVGNVPACFKGTQMNHGYEGLFLLAPEACIAGDAVRLRTVSDIGYMGTPYCIEVLVVPDFDPEKHWVKDGSINNNERLDYRCIWFHSPVVYQQGIIPLTIELEGKFSYDQTIGSFMDTDTVSMQWTCEFLLGNAGGDGATEPPPGFPSKQGPTSKVLQPLLYDKNALEWVGFQRWWMDHSSWTILVKAIHPSERGRPGYHADYPGQPFSPTLGNGGVLLGCWGSQPGLTAAQAKAPWGPRFRTGSVHVEWIPGGTH
jgi:hypothetical protein